MASNPNQDTRAQLDAAIARAARELRDDPEAAIRIPPPLSDEELAELEREEEALLRQLEEFYAAHPDIQRVNASDFIIEDRGAE